MKTKRFDKKLVLNKKTIAHLVNGEMKAVEGGVLITYTCPDTCRTCPTDCKTCGAMTGYPICYACGYDLD